MKPLLAALFIFSTALPAAALEERIDWASFLAGHDPVWNRMGKVWWEAPFVGDGELGMMARLAGDRTLSFQVGSNRVHDHRSDDLWKERVPDAIEVQNRGRLPIGRFELRTEGRINPAKSTARIDLWNAQASGKLVTDRGRIDWRIFIHATNGTGVIELNRSGAESDATLGFVAESAVSPRESKLPEEFRKQRRPNPSSKYEGNRSKGRVDQPLAAGGGYVTAWEQKSDKLFWTVVHDRKELPSAKAQDRVRASASTSFDTLEASHRDWWHKWYPKSFFSFGDPYWESFYWIQIYKMAAATRGDRGLIDNSGPWFQPSDWAAAWWNLNVQLSYSPFYSSGRFAEGASLPKHLVAGLDGMIRSVDEKYRADSAALARNTGPDLFGWAGQPGGRPIRERGDIGMEAGNLLWVCHNLYRHYRVSMDETMGKDQLFPLLKRAVNYHRHFLSEGPDGFLHLPKTYSPEYAAVADANYDLAGLVWGCRTLLELDERFGANDPLAAEWRRILEKLVPFAKDKGSYLIGAGMPYQKSHRHWSHLMMIYPYGLVTPESHGAGWVRSNLDHWHSKTGALQGYSFTGGIAMSAMLGDGERAQGYLDGFQKYIQAGTLYKEGTSPVMETPLHGAAVLQEMAFRSQNGVIEVFPALSPDWERTIFRGFTAEGGFEVNAAAGQGKVRWIILTAPHAGEVVLSAKGIGELKRETKDMTVEVISPDRIKLICKAGGRIDLTDGTTAVVESVGGKGTNPFGLK